MFGATILAAEVFTVAASPLLAVFGSNTATISSGVDMINLVRVVLVVVDGRTEKYKYEKLLSFSWFAPKCHIE